MKKIVVPCLAIMLVLALSPAAQTQEQLPLPQKIFAPVQGGHTDTGQAVSPYKEDRLMIKFTTESKVRLNIQENPGKTGANATTGLASVDALNARHRVQRIKKSMAHAQDSALSTTLGIDRWYKFDLAQPGDMQALAKLYTADPNIEVATPDYRAFPHAVPNDPTYPQQWGHNNTGQLLNYCWGCGGHPAGTPVGTPGFDSNAETAWNQGFGDPNVKIAILDSGVNLSHPDLVANLIAGYDFGDDDPNPEDNSASPGHGTACAGVAAAVANNNLGVAGVAGACSIMPLKVADSNGTLFFSYIQDGLVYAGDNGADVASMSFGASISSDPATDAALAYAFQRGVVLVASTGNENNAVVGYPSIYKDCIAVGAASPCGDRKRSSSNPGELNPGVSSDPNGYTCDGERWWGSNYGSASQGANNNVDIIAPTILPTTDIAGAGGYVPGDYELWFNGTSCSVPYVSGVVGLMRSADPTLTPAQVRTQLRNTAIDIVNVEAGAGWDRYSGYGMVDAAAAIGGGGPAAPVAEFSGTPTSGDVPLTVNFSDQSTGSVTSWQWNFGDSNTSTAQNPQHTYTSAGTYNVELIVTGPGGSDFEFKSGYITATDPPVGGGTIGEIGSVSQNQTGGGATWYTVNLNNSYSSPVVVMRGLSTRGGHKTHLRVRSASSSSFEFNHEEWDYHDGNHTTETCPYAVMEAGSHTLEGGQQAEAGTASVSTSWVTINFSPAFSSTPTLLTGIMSNNDSAAVITRTRNLTASSFQIKIQEEEAADGVHANETVAWIAMAQGVGSNDGKAFEASRTPNAVTDQNYTINFGITAGDRAILLTHDDTYDGGNTCGTRYRTLSPTSATIFIEEEQSADSEVAHITEVVSYLVWHSAGDIVSSGSSSELVIGKRAPTRATAFEVFQNHPNPFNPQTTIRFRLPAGAQTSVRIFDIQGRLVHTLVDKPLEGGEHRYQWTGLDRYGQRVSSGVYLYRVRSGEFVESRRMTLVK